MIFKTIDADATNLTKKMGLLGKSFNDIKKDYSNGLGITKSLFSTSISESDWKSLQKFNSAIKVTNDGLTKSQRITKAWNENMTGCSIAAKRMGNDLVTGKKKISDVSSAMKTATASTKALEIAMNVFANVGFMLAITAVTKVISELAQAQSNAVETAKEATSAYNDELLSIKDYKEKISKLNEELNSGNLSYEETKTKRSELMSIQDELIEKFGTEKSAIESVTEAIGGQVDALDDLNEKSYREWIAKADDETIWTKLLPWGKSGLNQAIDYMESKKTVSFFDMANANGTTQDKYQAPITDEIRSIQEEIDKTIQSKYNLEKEFATFKLTGTPEEIKSQLESIRQDYLDLSKYAFLENGISSEYWDAYRSEAIESINDIINQFDEGLEKHQETYKTYIEGMIKYDSEYSDEYATILRKRAELEDAENSGDTEKIQKARQEFMDAITAGITASESDENIKKYFESLYPELQAEFANWNFEIAINANTDNLKDKAEEIGKQYSATDLLDMVNTEGVQEGEEAFNKLIDKAIEYGVCTDNSSEEVQKLIDLLVELGIVQGNIESDVEHETPILFEYLFNNDSIDLTKQKLLDLATSGELSAETITSTEDYKALLDELGISADEFVNKISEFNIQYNEDNYNLLIDLLSRVRKGEILSADEATTLIATYDSLAGELVKIGDGYSFNESAIISLTNKYAETSNLAISNEVKKTNAAIEGVKERINAYGIEMEALKTIQKIYEDTGSKIEVMNWLKDNGYSMFMASNYLDVANEYSELEKKSESLKGKMLEQIETSSVAGTSALDRIKNKFQELTDVIGSNLNLIKSQISLLETRGSTVGRAYYDELISQSTEKINVLTEKYNELRKQFLQTDKGTEEWLELNAAILETQNAIIEAKTDIEGFQNSIDKLHWDELNKIADAIGNISDEAKSVIDLLNTDTVLDENGNLTKDAITALGMYGEQLESAQYLISKYSKEIEYLNGEYIKGTITVEEYNEKMQDLNDKQWESVDAYNSAKKAIIELRKKGIDEEIDALEELYDARKKAWEQEKDQHDWEKKVSEHDKSANKLKNQIAELMNDNSLAGIKKRKELEDELKDLESDWEDTLYDHVYDERQDQLDKELEDKKKALEKTLDDEEKLVADSIDLVNKNSTTILDNLNRLSREYGIQMSNSLTEPFTHGENALSHYSTMFSEANSAFTEQLNYTAMGIYQLQLDADNAAVSVVNMFNSANGTLLEQLSLVRQSLQEITDKANEAANAVRNAGMATPTTTTTTASNSTSSTNRSLGDMAHDTSGTTLPNAGTWKNVQNDIEKAKKNLETIEKQKKVGLVKNTPNKFTTISKGYASGTQSATKGLHPICEDGVEIIEKDGCLIYPIGAFDGGEKVFNNEQTQRLWELSQNPDVMEKFRQELLNIRPCIDFKFGNTAPVTKTNQNVNIQQHFDALVKVEGDMTPDVLAQLTNDRKVVQRVKDIAMEGNVEAYCTRGYRI